MTRYHVNPNTGRPNKCTASVRACPVGGEHYPSPEEARAGIEAKAAEEFSAVQEPMKRERTTAQKAKSAQALFASLSEEDQAELMDMLAERKAAKAELLERGEIFRQAFGKNMLKMVDPESCRETFEYALRDYTETYNPGCSGCTGDRSDYCRCRKYRGSLNALSSAKLARDLYNQLSDDAYIYDWDEASVAQQQVIDQFASMIARHGLDRSDIYEVNSSPDYYGESLDGVEFTLGNEARFKDFHKELLTSLGG